MSNRTTIRTQLAREALAGPLGGRQRQELVQEAINHGRAIHQQWHWDTKQTACPWGCGDGSGITETQTSSELGGTV